MGRFLRASGTCAQCAPLTKVVSNGYIYVRLRLSGDAFARTVGPSVLCHWRGRGCAVAATCGASSVSIQRIIRCNSRLLTPSQWQTLTAVRDGTSPGAGPKGRSRHGDVPADRNSISAAFVPRAGDAHSKRACVASLRCAATESDIVPAGSRAESGTGVRRGGLATEQRRLRRMSRTRTRIRVPACQSLQGGAT
jgi:hypothetical protein